MSGSGYCNNRSALFFPAVRIGKAVSDISILKPEVFMKLAVLFTTTTMASNYLYNTLWAKSKMIIPIVNLLRGSLKLHLMLDNPQ